MKVCQLLTSIDIGGAEMMALKLVQNTDRDDVSYSVHYLGGDGTLAADFEAVGATVRGHGSRTNPPQLDPSAFFRMVNALYREDFDVYHAHMPYTQVVGRLVSNYLGSAEMVSTLHTPVEVLPTPTRKPVLWTQSLDSATVAVSRGVYESYAERERTAGRWRDRTSPEGDRRWRTIHNGIEPEAFNEKVESLRADGESATLPENEIHVSNDEINFVNIARFIPEKSQTDLVEAMAAVRNRLGNAHLYVVGSSGPLEDELRDKVRELGLRDCVTVVHHDSREFDIHEFYAVADVFVSASVQEGMPVTLLEAMSSALPVVATRITGVEEVVADGETGRLVPPRSPDELASAMVEFASSTKRREFGSNGYDRVRERFHIRKTVDSYLDLYRELAGGAESESATPPRERLGTT